MILEIYILFLKPRYLILDTLFQFQALNMFLIILISILVTAMA